MTPRDHRCAGLSLVELMISILLGLVLVAGMVTVYLQSKRHARMDDELARLQENGRYALLLLKRELTLAGFYAGEPGIRDLAPPAAAPDCGAATDWSLNPAWPLELIDDFSGGLSTNTGNDLTCLGADSIRPGTDILALKRSAGAPTLRDGSLQGGATGAAGKQWYLRIAAHGGDISWRYLEGERFPAGDGVPGSQVDYWEAHARIFFVREFSLEGDGIPTLCVERLSANSMGPVECLVEGVADLQIEFGIDTDSDGVPNRYLVNPPGDVIGNAITATIHLLVRSLGPVAGHRDDRHYQLGQKRVPARRDVYLRRVFSTTVQIRNAVGAGL